MCFDKKKIEEYKFWKKYFLKINFQRSIKKIRYSKYNTFSRKEVGIKLGYNVPKPLIPISKKKCLRGVLRAYPTRNNLFIFREKLLKNLN